MADRRGWLDDRLVSGGGAWGDHEPRFLRAMVDCGQAAATFELSVERWLHRCRVGPRAPHAVGGF